MVSMHSLQQARILSAEMWTLVSPSLPMQILSENTEAVIAALKTNKVIFDGWFCGWYPAAGAVPLVSYVINDVLALGPLLSRVEGFRQIGEESSLVVQHTDVVFSVGSFTV